MSAIQNTGEQLLRLLASRGVAFFFVNSGTDFPSLVEALARSRDESLPAPKTLLVPHENVAVGMAYGVTLVSGTPQAVMVHVNVGTANALCGLINASRENIPMLLAAGRTPWMEKGSPASRSLNIHWAQEMFDQAGIVREHVKWDYELRSGEQLETVLDRALAIAQSEPQGPVYLSLPREVLAQPAPMAADTPVQRAALPPNPNSAVMTELARQFAQASKPLIITSRAGREPEAVGLLARLASEWAVPVVEFRPRHLSLPNTHAMHGGYEVGPWLGTADLIVVLDCDVPWIPSQGEPALGVPIIQVGSDPLFARYPVRGFRSDQTIQASPAAFLRGLLEAVATEQPDAGRLEARRQRVIEAGRSRRAALASAIETGRARSPMSMVAVSHAIGQALEAAGGEAVVVNEYSLQPAALRLEQPGSYFGSSPVGGLGWGLPAALGVKLARPQALVVAALGDGCYAFANPLACHHAAAMHGIAVLTVVMDNGGYGAVERATRAMYPQGHAASGGDMPLVSLSPMPDFARVIESCGGWGERVDHAQDLPGALQRAIHQVSREKRQALLHVRCS